MKGNLKMGKITDENILNALQKGKTVSLNGDILLKELLHGSDGVLYALYSENTFWKPYSPSVWELSQNTWSIENND